MWTRLYKLFFRPVLFRFEAETAHHLTVTVAAFFWKVPIFRTLTRVLFCRKGVTDDNTLFRNPIGLAAGFDKDAKLIPGIENLGFGFIEIGTVTPKPQTGNAKPRLFREPAQRAILNRMGFNNDGADAISTRVRAAKKNLRVPLGVNIGKNKDTPNSHAIQDYAVLLEKFRAEADYFTVNISSPNTPGLRELQSEEFLEALARKVQELKILQPVFIKLAPEVSNEMLSFAASRCGKSKPFAGLVLTNTLASDLGGISGRPLKEKSLDVLKTAKRLAPADCILISVGGIESADDVRTRLDAGANAVQIYSALIYEGPGLIREILEHLRS